MNIDNTFVFGCFLCFSVNRIQNRCYCLVFYPVGMEEQVAGVYSRSDAGMLAVLAGPGLF